ncbi:hypothetical protein RQP46_002543 [Phenoliferia psychrophenolica]
MMTARRRSSAAVLQANVYSPLRSVSPSALAFDSGRKARPRSIRAIVLTVLAAGAVLLYGSLRRNEPFSLHSKNLGEAVREYRRRYSREPPAGFNAWYDYAKIHDVKLIDEFDQINFDIAPFFALSPKEINDRIQKLNKTSTNHVFIKILPEAFVKEMADALRLLPDIDIPMYLHDGPNLFFDAEAKLGYLAAAKAGKFVNEDDLPVEGKTVWKEKGRTCLPNSKFRRMEMGLENEAKGLGPGFIQNHMASMDTCQEPGAMLLHGTDYMTPGIARLQAMFSLSKATVNGDILYDLNPANELPFSAKPHHKLMWRGSPDGVFVGQENTWRRTQRFRALYLTNSNETKQTRKIRLTSTDMNGREYQFDSHATLAQLNERYTNVRATGIAVQCEEEICKHVESVFDFQPKATLEEMSEHRYVLDVDGNAYSARFRTHLLSNQVPLKATRYPEFYSGRIQPWVHYSDLYNIMGFFSGDLSRERVGNHDAMAESIAVAGRSWAEHFWRPQDTQVYLMRLLLEYARLVDPTREASGKTATSPAWVDPSGPRLPDHL